MKITKLRDVRQIVASLEKVEDAIRRQSFRRIKLDLHLNHIRNSVTIIADDHNPEFEVGRKDIAKQIRGILDDALLAEKTELVAALKELGVDYDEYRTEGYGEGIKT